MLTNDKRQQLDDIVQQMGSQNASIEDVQAVVNDFKSKYDTGETTSPVLSQPVKEGKFNVMTGKTEVPEAPTPIQKEEHPVSDFLNRVGTFSDKYAPTQIISHVLGKLGQVAGGAIGAAATTAVRPIVGTAELLLTGKDYTPGFEETFKQGMQSGGEYGKQQAEQALPIAGQTIATGGANLVPRIAQVGLVGGNILAGGSQVAGGTKEILKGDSAQGIQDVGMGALNTVFGALGIKQLKGVIDDLPLSKVDKVNANDTTKNLLLKDQQTLLDKALKDDDKVAAIKFKKNINDVVDTFENPIDKKNPIIKNAVKQGIDDPIIKTISNGNEVEQSAKQQMQATYEALSKNKALSLLPERPIGDRIIDRHDFLQAKKQEIWDTISENLENMSSDPISMTNTYSNFMGNLSKEKVSVNPISGNLDFKGSTLENDVPGQKLLQQVYNEIYDNNAALSPQEINVIRKRIATDTDAFKKTLEHSSTSDAILKQTRKDLMADVEIEYPEYKVNNKNYAIASNALEDFYNKFITKDFMWKDDSSKSTKVAQVAKRMQGNASATYEDIFDNLDNTSELFGYEGKDNIRNLLVFNDLMKTLYGENKTGSLKGQVAGAINAAQNVKEGLDVASDVVLGGHKGFITGGIKLLKKIGNTDPEKQKKAIKELLNINKEKFGTEISQEIPKTTPSEHKYTYTIFDNPGAKSFEKDIQAYGGGQSQKITPDVYKAEMENISKNPSAQEKQIKEIYKPEVKQSISKKPKK